MTNIFAEQALGFQEKRRWESIENEIKCANVSSQ